MTLAKKLLNSVQNLVWLLGLAWELVRSLRPLTKPHEMPYKRCYTLSCHLWPLYLLIGIIQGSGIGNWLAKLMVPLAGSVWGLVLIGFICSRRSFSPLLAHKRYQSNYRYLIGVKIGKGNIPPQMALPALFCNQYAKWLWLYSGSSWSIRSRIWNCWSWCPSGTLLTLFERCSTCHRCLVGKFWFV